MVERERLPLSCLGRMPSGGRVMRRSTKLAAEKVMLCRLGACPPRGPSWDTEVCAEDALFAVSSFSECPPSRVL